MLLSILMELLERFLAGRLLALVESEPAPDQFAFRRARSMEILLSPGIAPYFAGLRIVAALHCSSHVKIALCIVGAPEARRSCGVPEIIIRFMGTWLAHGDFRVRLSYLPGTALSKCLNPAVEAEGGAIATISVASARK